MCKRIRPMMDACYVNKWPTIMGGRKERRKKKAMQGNVLPLALCAADEAALVKAAKQLGFVFTTRTPQTVEIEVVSGTLLLSQ